MVQFLVHSGINYTIVAHIFLHFGGYWVGWEDIHHSLQNMSLLCESMEYWLYNFIFEFWSIIQQHGQRISDFLKTHFLLNFGIFFSPESDFLYLSGPCFNVLMWPLLVLHFHIEVLMFHTGGDRSVSLFQHPILVQSWYSFFPLKAICYTFQDHVLICKCGQYLLSNFSPHFWVLMQEERRSEFH